MPILVENKFQVNVFIMGKKNGVGNGKGIFILHVS